MLTDWPLCEVPGCSGARLADGCCLAHASDSQLSRLGRRLIEGEPLDGRGVHVDARLLESLLARCRDAAGDSHGVEVLFDGACFDGDVSFEGAIFRDDARFCGATFGGDCLLERATFLGSGDFSDAVFEGEFDAAVARFTKDAVFHRSRFAQSAYFRDTAFERDVDFAEARIAGEATLSGSRIGGEADFVGCRFGGEAHFAAARFAGRADFDRASFDSAVSFDAAHFHGRSEFDRAAFAGDAWFDKAVFAAEADYSDANFEADAWFYGTTFEHRARFDRVAFAGATGFIEGTFRRGASFDGAKFEQVDLSVKAPHYVSLERAHFALPTTLDLDAPLITCLGARFAEGGELRIHRGEIALDAVHSGRPLVVAGSGTPVPRVVSLRQADVGNLLLADVDLRACRFVGAHGLDRLRLEGAVQFARSPRGWHWQTSPPWVLRWTRRWTLAEEQEWRAACGQSPDWYPPECRPPAWLGDVGEPEALEPGRIALLYRALRKGREDSKDEPGAADFYYGEMEMRRHAHASTGSGGTTSRVERTVLWLYWAVSGYGLRAARALGALMLTVATFAIALWAFGFDPDQSLGRALLFSAESTSSLFRAPETVGFSLTYAGEVLQMALRLLGPLFFGLTLLAVRARVKR